MSEEAALVEMGKAFAYKLDALKGLLDPKHLSPWPAMSALPPLEPVLKFVKVQQCLPQ